MFMNNVSNRKYKSLLEKHDIPIENISYEYITQCTSAREIENIIRILRSGEEGYYPDLLRFSEQKLASIKPNSFLLQTEKPAISKHMLPPEECKIIENDLDNWIREIKSKEHKIGVEEKSLSDIHESMLPEVRDVNKVKKSNATSKISEKKEKKIGACDYGLWDKYDVDTELNRIELQEEQKQIQAKRTQQEEKERQVKYKVLQETSQSSLTDTEQSAMAEAERIKGNEAFKAGDFNQALELYNSSIKLHDNIAAYNNRAMTFIKLKRFSAAYEDCCTVLKAEPKNIKALFRRGVALENLQRKTEALRDFETVFKLEPNNKEAKLAIHRLGGTTQKSVRMKIVNENEKFVESQSAVVRVPFSYYKRLTYADLFSTCNCLALPTSSYHIYPVTHPRNVHCIIGERVEAKRFSAMRTAKINSEINQRKLKLKTKDIQNDDDNNNNNNVNPISCETRNENDNHDSKVRLKNNSNESQFTSNADLHEAKSKNEHIMSNKEKFNTEVSINKISTYLQANSIESKNCEAFGTSSENNNNNEFIIDKIESPYQFLLVWQNLKNDSTMSGLAKLLRSFDPNKFVTVVGNNMDSDIWSTIIRCLVNYFLRKEDLDLVVNYLKSFKKICSFEIILMFMSAQDKEGLQQIFSFLEKNGSVDLEELRAIFEF